MTRPNTQEISSILNNLLFSDGTSVASRASELVIRESNLGFSIDITGIDLAEAESIRTRITSIFKDNYKETNVSIVLTSKREKKLADPAQKAKIHIEGAGKVLIVTAGKGGVGKSTISALLAHSLKQKGKKVGILDADIYGPSMPQIFAINEKPNVIDKKMIPLESYGIQLNSIGFVTDPASSISWRGPMTSKALYQLVSLTKWDNLDYLIIDMPPGTGDIHLSLLESYQIDAALIVTTPQKISEIDVERSINLYQKFQINIVGVIENMSFYIDKDTEKKTPIFAGSSGQDIASKHNIPLLAKLPIKPELSAACDNGDDLANFTHLLDEAIEVILQEV